MEDSSRSGQILKTVDFLPYVKKSVSRSVINQFMIPYQSYLNKRHLHLIVLGLVISFQKVFSRLLTGYFFNFLNH